ncbi:hypothetical protein PC110_g8074 [Phytophthora cactorum]|uniref:Uncharacterized protein n=2 Tax=Phytophthora cactorum TaxID=29920 RepID=A0A329SHR7_9STRA|nr:hypothetical protein PC110_g8074 [Phytophthora cactorum]
MDSLTKAFAYVDTTAREDQRVGNILAGHNDPHVPCVAPTIRTLAELMPALEYAQLLTLRGQHFKNISGFSDMGLNVDENVLGALMGSLLIHLEEVSAVVTNAQVVSGRASYYMDRFMSR